MPLPPHIAVIDPAVKVAETDCFNHLLTLSPLPLSYHVPAIHGFKSLERETENLKGIILFGSESSVNDGLPWQRPLENWLSKKLDSKVPTFGCCYGHQMLAYMFGGKVDFRTPDRKKLLGFREVELVEDSLWGNAQKGNLYVTHNEVVTEVPSGFKIVASSKDVRIDGLRHTTLPIWSFQPHPEATRAFAKTEGVKAADASSLNFGYSLLNRFLELCSGNG